MAVSVFIMLAPGSAIVVGVLLAPAMLLLMLPGHHGGARTVQVSLVFGLAACVHPLHTLWLGDNDAADALSLLQQPMVMPTAWIAVLAGWLVTELAAAVLRIHADFGAARQRRQMLDQIAVLEAEWGPLPASAPLPLL